MTKKATKPAGPSPKFSVRLTDEDLAVIAEIQDEQGAEGLAEAIRYALVRTHNLMRAEKVAQDSSLTDELRKIREATTNAERLLFAHAHAHVA